jgi:hypothetical protein
LLLLIHGKRCEPPPLATRMLWGRRSNRRITGSTVRQYVHLKKQALRLYVAPEPCVPQQYAWGEEAQVDWYEADADQDGEQQTLHGFLEAHRLAFQHLDEH